MDQSVNVRVQGEGVDGFAGSMDNAVGSLMSFKGAVGAVGGALAALSAGALAAFLLVSGVTFHDFWAVDDPEEQQAEMTNFLKNAFGAGAALAFLAVGGTPWPYALGVGLV